MSMHRASLALLAAVLVGGCARAPRVPALGPVVTASDEAQDAFFAGATSLCSRTHQGHLRERARSTRASGEPGWLETRDCDTDQVRMRIVTNEAAVVDVTTLVLRHSADGLLLERFGIGNPIFGRNTEWRLVPLAAGSSTRQLFVPDSLTRRVRPEMRDVVVMLEIAPGHQLTWLHDDRARRARQWRYVFDLEQDATIPTMVQRQAELIERRRLRNPGIF